MAAKYRVLAWRIPWREEPGGLQTVGLQRVGHDERLSTQVRVFQYKLCVKCSLNRMRDVFLPFQEIPVHLSLFMYQQRPNCSFSFTFPYICSFNNPFEFNRPCNYCTI